MHDDNVSIWWAVIFGAIGVVAFLASLCNWEWYFRLRNAQRMDNIIGRTANRILNGIVGIFIVFCAIMMVIQG